MIELGATAFAVDGDGDAVYLVSSFSAAINPPTQEFCFEERCKKEFWEKPPNNARLPILFAIGVDASNAMRSFAEWLDSLGAEHLVQLSDMPQFDSAWIDRYHEMYTDVKYPVYLRRTFADGSRCFEPAICTDSVFRAILKDCTTPYVSTERACAAVGAAYYKPAVEHVAMYDAMAIGVNFFRVASKAGFKL
jgi:hypothetical protein